MFDVSDSWRDDSRQRIVTGPCMRFEAANGGGNTVSSTTNQAQFAPTTFPSPVGPHEDKFDKESIKRKEDKEGGLKGECSLAQCGLLLP